MLERSIALFLGDYYHGATNVLVQNNMIFGYCQAGMWIGPWGGWNTITENDLSGLTTYDAQVWESARHDVFKRNIFGPIDNWITAIDMFSWGHDMALPEPTAFNSFLKNNYRMTGLPGWDEGAGVFIIGYDWGWPGALNEVRDNLIFESGGFPVGTGGAKFQVNDLGINNRVIGHPAVGLTNPGIGQTMKEARQQAMEALMQMNAGMAVEPVKKK